MLLKSEIEEPVRSWIYRMVRKLGNCVSIYLQPKVSRFTSLPSRTSTSRSTSLAGREFIVLWQQGPSGRQSHCQISPPFRKSSLTHLRVRSPSIRVTSRFRVRHLSWAKTYSRFDSNTTPPKCPKKQRIQKTSFLWK
jgi:hypothetical protein